MRSRHASRFAFVAASLCVAAIAVPDAPASGLELHTTSRSAVFSYPGCPAGAVRVTITVPRRPVPSGTPVRYAVTVRNRSQASCGPPGSTVTLRDGATLRSTLLSRCGSLPVVIEDQRGQRVYPPFLAIMCPNLIAPTLMGRASVTATGSWNQTEGGAGRPARRQQVAPRGIYRVVVGDAVGARIVLVGAGGSH
jgi:hypothetical protein